MPEKLSYARRGHLPRGVSLRPALILALAPLVCGLLILSLWAATGWKHAPFLGLANIPAGLVCVILAILWARRYAKACQAWDAMPRPHAKLWPAIVILLALLNFPACLLCFTAGYWLLDRYTLTVRNDGTTAITNCTITAPAGPIPLGAIPPGQAITHSWNLGHEGQISCQAIVGGQTLLANVDGYAGSDDGPRWKTVRFNGAAPPTVR